MLQRWAVVQMIDQNGKLGKLRILDQVSVMRMKARCNVLSRHESRDEAIAEGRRIYIQLFGSYQDVLSLGPGTKEQRSGAAA